MSPARTVLFGVHLNTDMLPVKRGANTITPDAVEELFAGFVSMMRGALMVAVFVSSVHEAVAPSICAYTLKDPLRTCPVSHQIFHEICEPVMMIPVEKSPLEREKSVPR